MVVLLARVLAGWIIFAAAISLLGAFFSVNEIDLSHIDTPALDRQYVEKRGVWVQPGSREAVALSMTKRPMAQENLVSFLQAQLDPWADTDRASNPKIVSRAGQAASFGSASEAQTKIASVGPDVDAEDGVIEITIPPRGLVSSAVRPKVEPARATAEIDPSMALGVRYNARLLVERNPANQTEAFTIATVEQTAETHEIEIGSRATANILGAGFDIEHPPGTQIIQDVKEGLLSIWTWYLTPVKTGTNTLVVHLWHEVKTDGRTTFEPVGSWPINVEVTPDSPPRMLAFMASAVDYFRRYSGSVLSQAGGLSATLNFIVFMWDRRRASGGEEERPRPAGPKAPARGGQPQGGHARHSDEPAPEDETVSGEITEGEPPDPDHKWT